jgi:tryptophan synthase beta chain
MGRVKYFSASDREALDAFVRLSRLEGVIPALESAHAVAHAMRVAPRMPKESIVAICLSGRGDKDVFSVAAALGQSL